MKWLPAVALCLAVTYVSGQSYDDWIKTVYNRVGDNVTFNCTDTIGDDEGHPRPDGDYRGWENATVLYWLAQFERVDINGSIRDGKIVVINDGWTMHVRNVTPEDHGIYHCVMNTTDDQIYMVKWGINMRGPYFIDLWDKYELNVIIGFCAMGGFLIIAALILGVYHFRWVDPNEELNEKSDDKIAYVNQGYSNGDYNEPKAEVIGYDTYDDVKIPPYEDYSVEMKNNPAVVSVAEVHSDSANPVYVGAAPTNSAASELPEPETDTKF